MRRFRALTLSVLIGATGLAALASPAAAAAPRLAFVNGIPGQVLDVCVGRRELKSNLRYGRWFEATVGTGEHMVKFRRASSGTCKGTTLARQPLNLATDVDRTVVATARSPKVVVFDNRLAPAPTVNNNWMAVRHAADVGSVVFSIVSGSTVSPSAPPAAFTKGSQWMDRWGPGANLPILFSAFKPSKASPFVGPAQVLTYEGRRHEVVLVGSRTSNARFVIIVRDTIAP
jgi:hypothetical protein